MFWLMLLRVKVVLIVCIVVVASDVVVVCVICANIDIILGVVDCVCACCVFVRWPIWLSLLLLLGC